MSGGRLGSSVCTSRDHAYGKHEGYLLGDVIGRLFITDRGSSDGSSDGEDSLMFEVCYPSGLSVRISNFTFAVNVGESPLVGGIGSDSGTAGGSSDGIPYGKFVGDI